ncbi:MAG: hypothetical protein OSB67_07250 [Alphaproteobacteria bacterium]|nr:hypothetical protein [Alphaproteobacteria bacterium]
MFVMEINAIQINTGSVKADNIAQAREGAGQTSAELDLNYLSAVWARILIAQHRIL